MEQISRSPGSTADIRKRTDRRYMTDKWYTTSQVYLVDLRPEYPSGLLDTIGNGKFRRPTSYRHSSYETRIVQPYEGFIHSGPTQGRRAIDYGRNSTTIANDYCKSLFSSAEHPPTASSGIDEAIVKALLQLADQKAGIGEDLATFRQTASLFANKSSLLLAALKAMRSRRSWWRYMHKSIRQVRKEPASIAAQTYIEYVYGLKPLVGDVYGVAELLKEQTNNLLLLHGRGKSSRTDNRPSVSAWNYNYSESRARRLYAEETAKHRVDLYARIDPDSSGLRTLNQLGLLNPASLAWNLVPWSFVVDWFLPIGSVLEALSAPAGLKFVGGTKSTRSSGFGRIEYQVDSLWVGAGWSNVTTVTTGLMDYEYQGYRRTALADWPLPGFYVAADPFKGDRAFKALALGILQLKRWRNNH